MDLTVDDEHGEAWDFDRKSKRDAALGRVRREKPKFLILSPMCRAFSSWQNLNRMNQNSAETRGQKLRAMIHLRFAMELAKEQMLGGRYFVFEHPAMATSWNERCVRSVLEMPDMERVMSHLCQFEYQDPRDGSPLKKPTYFMSNSEEVLANLERKCTGQDGMCSRARGGRHTQIAGRRLTRHSQIYSDEVCKAMLQGMINQLKADGEMLEGCVGIQVAEEIVDKPTSAILKSAANGYSGKYRDDVTKQVLKDELVLAARRVELDFFFTAKGVWGEAAEGRGLQEDGAETCDRSLGRH